jgi:hypothetical protein
MSMSYVIPLGLLVFVWLWAWLSRSEASRQRARRGTGHAMLGLQQFIEPSVEYIFEAENLEQKEEDEGESGDEDDREAILADLAASLGRDPIDPEEVRRHLASALRAGVDWREAFEAAVELELAERPYRRPAMPPVWKVAPRE